MFEFKCVCVCTCMCMLFCMHGHGDKSSLALQLLMLMVSPWKISRPLPQQLAYVPLLLASPGGTEIISCKIYHAWFWLQVDYLTRLNHRVQRLL